MSGEPVVLHERRGPVLLLTLNRPERLNAWTYELEERYFDLLGAADADPEVRAIVVTGAGRGFCAGADMEELEGVSRSASEYREGTRPKSFPMTIRKPMIAAINGACAGLGLVQALYCDVRFAAAEAKLTTAFVRRGLIAEYGIAWPLARVVGTSRALDLLLSGRVVLGEDALRMGLADFAAPRADVLEHALAYATDLAESCSPASMATIKAQVREALTSEFERAFAEADRLMYESFERPDVAEGVASFQERRAPRFPALPAEP